MFWLDIYVINIFLPQISCVRQLIKPNIVYKDTTGMTNRMTACVLLYELPEQGRT